MKDRQPFLKINESSFKTDHEFFEDWY